MRNARCRVVRLSFAVLIIALSLFASAKPKTTIDAVYSNQQAKTGERLYQEHCLICHDKKYFQPVLEVWSGQSVATLFQMMSATMPEADPGSLHEKEYVDILAYIFSLSKFPAGEDRLENRGGKFDEIIIANP